MALLLGDEPVAQHLAQSESQLFPLVQASDALDLHDVESGIFAPNDVGLLAEPAGRLDGPLSTIAQELMDRSDYPIVAVSSLPDDLWVDGPRGRQDGDNNVIKRIVGILVRLSAMHSGGPRAEFNG